MNARREETLILYKKEKNKLIYIYNRRQTIEEKKNGQKLKNTKQKFVFKRKYIFPSLRLQFCFTSYFFVLIKYYIENLYYKMKYNNTIKNIIWTIIFIFILNIF